MFFATASRGLEPLLAAELKTFGATAIKERNGGVEFSGDQTTAYRACLWSRLASRVLLPLSRLKLEGEDASDALYQAAAKVDWPELFDVKSTFAILVAGHSPSISHTHYAGLKVKDAIADTFRAKSGERPTVDTDNPQLRIHLHLARDHADLSMDLSGMSLHRRGYRRAGGSAPLKESLAAAILIRAGWPELAKQNAPLLDPMCGSGTLVIEAALMCADVAPGLERERFGFEAWLEHKPALWRDLQAEAKARAQAGRAKPLPVMCGEDVDLSAIRAAQDNAKAAGLADHVRFAQGDVAAARPASAQPGLVVVNPPYGERMGEEAEVIKLHSLLGATLKQNFGGWQAAVFTGRPDLGPRIGLRAKDMYSFYNGPLPCKLLLFDVPQSAPGVPGTLGGGDDFANRLNKNLKHLTKWAKREGVVNYRVYDADLPDYAVAVDIYLTHPSPSGGGGKNIHVHIQEYAAPKTVDPMRAERRLREALAHTQQILDIPSSNLHYKLRRSQRSGFQYGRQAETGEFHEIEEHGCKLLVNFEDYLDTGLFLDHRPLRLRIQQEAKGKRFLNLFCYTASATAHAIQGGAVATLSVDMSNTYLEWAQKNLTINRVRSELFDHAPARMPAHALLRADCVEWLKKPAQEKFDLILLDPPTFSNSTKMAGVLDIQRDHPELIQKSAALLSAGGTLYFSTNRRGFKLNAEAPPELSATDITAQTLGEDFKRPPPSHRCWRIRHK